MKTSTIRNNWQKINKLFQFRPELQFLVKCIHSFLFQLKLIISMFIWDWLINLIEIICEDETNQVGPEPKIVLLLQIIKFSRSKLPWNIGCKDFILNIMLKCMETTETWPAGNLVSLSLSEDLWLRRWTSNPWRANFVGLNPQTVRIMYNKLTVYWAFHPCKVGKCFFRIFVLEY